MDKKTCTKCDIEKPITDYPIADKQGHRRSWCKACENARVRAYYRSNEQYRLKTRARSKAWQQANPRPTEVQRRYQLKSMYGLSIEQYDAMLAAQGGKCALCGTDDHGRRRTSQGQKWNANHWNIDHCHVTGRVRGLLCHRCNATVGGYERLVRDVGLEKVVAYLILD